MAIMGYAKLLSDTIGDSITLDVERVGETLQIMKITASKVEVPF